MHRSGGFVFVIESTTKIKSNWMEWMLWMCWKQNKTTLLQIDKLNQAYPERCNTNNFKMQILSRIYLINKVPFWINNVIKSMQIAKWLWTTSSLCSAQLPHLCEMESTSSWDFLSARKHHALNICQQQQQHYDAKLQSNRAEYCFDGKNKI